MSASEGQNDTVGRPLATWIILDEAGLFAQAAGLPSHRRAEYLTEIRKSASSSSETTSRLMRGPTLSFSLFISSL